MAIINSGGTGTGTVTTVTSTNTGIAVATPTTHPALTLATLDVIAADGPPALNWSNNSKKITGLAASTVAGDAVRFEQVAVTWAAYTPSTTGITGGSGAGSCFFAQVGNIVYVVYGDAGTSNATTKSFTLPVSTGSNGAQYGGLLYFVKDSGAALTSPGSFYLANNSTVCTMAKTMNLSSGGWTASGAWQVNVVFFYGTN